MTPARRLYSLDLLRALAIAGVLLFHFPRPESAIVFRAISHLGWWGVDLFFILSGFLIGSQWLQSLQSGRGSVMSFFYRRFMRTLPPYYVFLAGIAVYRLTQSVAPPSLLHWVFAQNLHGLTDLTHTWSLCVEEHFYLGFPLVAWVVWKRPSWAGVTFALFVLTPATLRAAMWFMVRPDLLLATDIHNAFAKYHDLIFYPTHMRWDTLVMGTGLAWVHVRRPDVWAAWLKRAPWFAGIAVACLGAAATTHRLSFAGSVLSFSLIGIGFAAMLVFVMGTQSWITRYEIPGVRWLALTSYSLYLTHPVAFGIAEHAAKYFQWPAYGFASIALIFATTATLTGAMYGLVERPCLRWRDRKKMPPPSSSPHLARAS